MYYTYFIYIIYLFCAIQEGDRGILVATLGYHEDAMLKDIRRSTAGGGSRDQGFDVAGVPCLSHELARVLLHVQACEGGHVAPANRVWGDFAHVSFLSATRISKPTGAVRMLGPSLLPTGSSAPCWR